MAQKTQYKGGNQLMILNIVTKQITNSYNIAAHMNDIIIEHCD